MSKPEDISQEAWDASGDLLTSVTNDNHCWGIFDNAPEAYPGDLQRAFARAIMAAKAEEREACAKLADDFQWLLPIYEKGANPNIASDDAACAVQADIANAIRKRGHVNTAHNKNKLEA